MSHYFHTPQGQAPRHIVEATIWGRDYQFESATGVFSANRLDVGTSVLFRIAAPPLDRPARFLDLGCGVGPIAMALAIECPQARIDAVDTNHRAIELTARNAELLHVADRVQVHDEDPRLTERAWAPSEGFDEIWSNPPIRIGKPALHDLLHSWLPLLTPDGSATFVVGKNLGADSLHSWLESNGWAVERLGSSRGFRVLRVRRTVLG
ncbi:MAG: methyltransferase [Propionibacteriaceae bacterium]|jgi:16S rRNA G1207 methylase RsmC|nr:methyltransferase [Propionibacteriaceae bacterium]